MNKRGSYLALFVFVTIFALFSLFVVILHAQSNRDGVLGFDSSSVYRSYDEGEKISLYLDLSVINSKNNAFSELDSNGGFLAESSCSKVGDYVLISDSCPEFNPKKYFYSSFSSELEKYLGVYDSTYALTDFEKVYSSNKFYRKFGLTPDIISSEFNYLAESSNAAVNNVKFVIENGVISFSPLNLRIESNPESVYTIVPKFNFENTHLNDYDKVYSSLASGCLLKSVDQCSSYLVSDLEAVVVVDGSIIKAEYRGIRFAFDVSKGLPVKLTFADAHTIT